MKKVFNYTVLIIKVLGLVFLLLLGIFLIFIFTLLPFYIAYTEYNFSSFLTGLLSILKIVMAFIMCIGISFAAFETLFKKEDLSYTSIYTYLKRELLNIKFLKFKNKKLLLELDLLIDYIYNKNSSFEKELFNPESSSPIFNNNAYYIVKNQLSVTFFYSKINKLTELLIIYEILLKEKEKVSSVKKNNDGYIDRIFNSFNVYPLFGDYKESYGHIAISEYLDAQISNCRVNMKNYIRLKKIIINGYNEYNLL